MKSFNIDGMEYPLENLSQKCQTLAKLCIETEKKIQKLNNDHAIITRAKNGYIEDLKLTIVEAKSGLDLSALICED